MSKSSSRWLAAVWLLSLAVPSFALEEVKIGVLAYRPKLLVQAQWQPLGVALHQAMPEYGFSIVSYDYAELQAAVASRQVDFVLTNPGNYLLMAHRSGLSAPLATLSNLEHGQPVNAMGGVIFTRADRADIKTLQDLRGRSVAVTSIDSLGGYEMQAYELSLIGLRMAKDVHVIPIGMPHDNVVKAVLAKRADVGFVRSGLLEALADEGKLDLTEIRVINRQDLPGFPVQVSTRLYPEWPLAALPHTDKDIKRKVASFLLTMHDNKALAQVLQIHGFDVPADYSSVEELLRELRMPPFDVAPEFTAADVWRHYRWPIVASLIAFTLILLLGFNLLRVNRRLRSNAGVVQEQADQIRDKERLLLDILNVSPIAVRIAVDKGRKVVFHNQGYADLIKNADALGVDPGTYYVRVEEYEAVVAELAQGKSILNRQVELRIPNGGAVWALASYMPISYRGEEAVLGWFYDITERIATSKQLQELNESMAATLQAIPDILFEIGPQGEYLNVWTQNPELLVAQKESLLGHTVREVLPPEAADTIMIALREADEKGASRGHVIKFKLPHGDSWFELSVAVKTGEHPSGNRYIVLSRDITGRKKAESALRHATQKLQIALEGSQISIWELDTNTNEVWLDAAWAIFLGQPPAETRMPFSGLLSIVHPDDRQHIIESSVRCLKGEADRYLVEHRVKSANGDWKWVLSRGRVVERDSTGRALRVSGTNTNITERKQAESELQLANRTLVTLGAVNRNLVHATDDIKLLQAVCQTIVSQRGYLMAWVGYLQHDAERTIRPVAQAGFEEGYLEDAGIVWADTERGRGTTGRAARTGQLQIAQDIRTDDSMIPWRVEAQERGYTSCISLPLAHEGKVFGVLVIYAAQADAYSAEEAVLLQEMTNDLAFGVRSLQARHERDIALEQLSVTALQLEKANVQIEEERERLVERVEERTAQLLYANKAKDSFLATMSHEIRTPLGGLLGMMELLNISRLDDQQREMLEAARGSGKSLLRIVDDILDWSKIEAGKLVLAPHLASIENVLNGVVSTYAQLASAKDLVLRQHVDPRLGAAHIFDQLRVSQILNNFTSNAIKFTEQGTVEISAELIAKHQGYEQVRFCVKDSGVGISAAEQVRLFQKYEQASADTARMYGGTGLGLAICRSLAELMEGTLSVESTPLNGSSFCLDVRLQSASPSELRELGMRYAAADESENETDITPLQADGRLISVLVVDDHPVNRMLLKQQLDVLGMQVDVAADGVDALALWQDGHYDLVITDCHMPEMDGYELTRNIREIERRAGRQPAPVIAWTANVLAEEEGRCRAAGMDDLLTKPTELSDLRATLLKWLMKANVVVASPAVAVPQAARRNTVTDDVLDVEVLKKIAKSRTAQVELLHEFDTQNRRDVAELNSALQAGDLAAAARSAHRIKGACRMVGALELEGVVANIEQAARQEDRQGASMAGFALAGAVARIAMTIGMLLGEL